MEGCNNKELIKTKKKGSDEKYKPLIPTIIKYTYTKKTNDSQSKTV